MKVKTEDGTFTGEDRYVALHIDDEVREKVEKGALQVNMIYPVHARYEYEGRREEELRDDPQALVHLQRQDIENIRNMPEEGYCIYSIYPSEDRSPDEISELDEQFKEEIHGN